MTEAAELCTSRGGEESNPAGGGASSEYLIPRPRGVQVLPGLQPEDTAGYYSAQCCPLLAEGETSARPSQEPCPTLKQKVMILLARLFPLNSVCMESASSTSLENMFHSSW
ncbi:hypothetical protein EYF80_060723 [Liparis tanakae]|uniref:Uncharacterized protein n=1 Tax=Liparis tanakae TaxID=230148 RepID=A0A4Z2EK34_9TELE|nr:hypothetical protein EYF80_060723 [Liparis tanakae]